MKLTGFMVVIIAALMFLIPTMQREQQSGMEIEAQEETFEDTYQDIDENSYRITYRSQSEDEESIADIIWMKKAAAVASDAGIPYFNVLIHESKKVYDKTQRREVSEIEGIIQLDSDPMKAEFDAQEIQSLVLTDEVSQ